MPLLASRCLSERRFLTRELLRIVEGIFIKFGIWEVSENKLRHSYFSFNGMKVTDTKISLDWR
jgi:hypothetical protein